MKAQPINCLLCDDARVEITNKDLLIGVFTSSLRFFGQPAGWSGVLWANFSFQQGAYDFHQRVRLSRRGKESIIPGRIKADEAQSTRITLMINFLLREDDELVYEFKCSQQDEWSEAARWSLSILSDAPETEISKEDWMVAEELPLAQPRHLPTASEAAVRAALTPLA